MTLLLNPESKQPLAHTTGLFPLRDLCDQEAASTLYHRASKTEPALTSLRSSALYPWIVHTQGDVPGESMLLLRR